MATQVVGVKSNVANGNLGLVRMKCGIGLCESITLQHVEHRGLASIVESQEYNICTLLEEAEPFHGTFEKVDNEHLT